jgi:LysR family transcriptional regulator for metE and metH
VSVTVRKRKLKTEAISNRFPYMSRLNRSHWQLLAALDALGTISAAAEAVHVTQSAATQRLREAERRMGVALVERSGKSLRLNRSGRRVAAAGRDLEARLSAAEADAVWLGRHEGERLRLCLPHYDDPGWIAGFARDLRAHEPAVEVELVRCGVRDAAQRLAGGEADAAVLPGRSDYPGVTAYELPAEPLRALVPPDGPLAGQAEVSAADLAPNGFLSYGDIPQPGFEFEGFFRPAGVFPARIVRVESTTAIAAMVAAGLGVSILADSAARTAAGRAGAVVRPLAGAELSVPWQLLVSQQVERPATRRASARLRAHLGGA